MLTLLLTRKSTHVLYIKILEAKLKCLNNSWHLKTSWSNSAHALVVTNLAKPYQARNNKTQVVVPVSGWVKKMQTRLWNPIPPPPQPHRSLFLLLTHLLNHQEVRSSKNLRGDFISRASQEQIPVWWGTGSKAHDGHTRSEILSSWSRHRDRKESERFGDSKDW